MSQSQHPRDSPLISDDNSSSKPFVETPPVSGEHNRQMSQDSFTSSKMSYGSSNSPNPGTYVIQVPKDHIYRVPSLENAYKFKRYTQKKSNSNCCRSCVCYTIATILILIVLLGITIGILFLIYHPKVPTYTINSVHVKGVNLTTPKATATTITPVFNITVKTDNRNGKISIYYEQGSKINIYRDGVNLCDGELPAFYQPPKSVTIFSTELTGSGIVLSKSARDKLIVEQKKEKVPLELDVTVPVRVKIRSVKFWTTTIKVRCDITLNALKANSKIISQKCKVKAKPW